MYTLQALSSFFNHVRAAPARPHGLWTHSPALTGADRGTDRQHYKKASRAFMSLEAEGGMPAETKGVLKRVAMNIFTRHQPVDPPDFDEDSAWCVAAAGLRGGRRRLTRGAPGCWTRWTPASVPASCPGGPSSSPRAALFDAAPAARARSRRSCSPRTCITAPCATTQWTTGRQAPPPQLAGTTPQRPCVPATPAYSSVSSFSSSAGGATKKNLRGGGHEASQPLPVDRAPRVACTSGPPQ